MMVAGVCFFPPSHAQMLHTLMNPTVTIASFLALSTCESDIT